jgi:hypothetical protein
MADLLDHPMGDRRNDQQLAEALAQAEKVGKAHQLYAAAARTAARFGHLILFGSCLYDTTIYIIVFL